MAANKVGGVRAATVMMSRRLPSRQHNDANVICLGERLTGIEVAKDALDAGPGALLRRSRVAVMLATAPPSSMRLSV